MTQDWIFSLIMVKMGKNEFPSPSSPSERVIRGALPLCPKVVARRANLNREERKEREV